MIWKGLMVVTGSESPIVVVLSGSMEPAFHRGDLLFLTNYEHEDIRVGEIVVFKVEGRDIPIVHRDLKLHEKERRWSGQRILAIRWHCHNYHERISKIQICSVSLSWVLRPYTPRMNESLLPIHVRSRVMF